MLLFFYTKYKNIFVGFLVQMKTLKFAFEINWPLLSISISLCFYFENRISSNQSIYHRKTINNKLQMVNLITVYQNLIGLTLSNNQVFVLFTSIFFPWIGSVEQSQQAKNYETT